MLAAASTQTWGTSVSSAVPPPETTNKPKTDLSPRISHAQSMCRKLEQVPTQAIPPDAVVETILAGLADARPLFEHGTMEERKRVIRAFVGGLTINGASQSGEVRMKKLPVSEMPSTGSSFELVAGARYEVQKRNLGREVEVVKVRFTSKGGALVPTTSTRRQST